MLRPRQIIAALEKAGFRLKRGNLLVTLPVHSGDISPTVLRSIFRQAQLTPEELVSLLKK